MKIAIIQPRTPYHVAGSEKVSLKHVEYLSKAGHVVDFYTSIPKSLPHTFLFTEFLENKFENVNLLQFAISDSLPDLYEQKITTDHTRWVTESFAFNEKIYEALKTNKPDVILSYYLPDSVFKPVGIPNVIYLSGYPSKPVPWYKSFIKFCHAAISISTNVSNKWTEELQEISLHYILGTGVDYPLPVKSVIQGKGRYNLVFAGRLIERKGIITLIEAFEKVASNYADVHLWILGEGELKDQIKDMIVEKGLKDKVTTTGIVVNPYDYFAMADICIFPSHHGDGLMGTVLESMAVGKPVITTIDNGNEDVIINNENGILIEPNNIEALALAIDNLLNDEDKRKRIGFAAEKRIASNVAWEINVDQLSCILEEVVSKIKGRKKKNYLDI